MRKAYLISAKETPEDLLRRVRQSWGRPALYTSGWVPSPYKEYAQAGGAPRKWTMLEALWTTWVGLDSRESSVSPLVEATLIHVYVPVSEGDSMDDTIEKFRRAGLDPNSAFSNESSYRVKDPGSIPAEFQPFLRKDEKGLSLSFHESQAILNPQRKTDN